MKNALEIRQTKDQSHTIYHRGLDETYHSVHGAIQESMHVFIKQGFLKCLQELGNSKIKILEIGFGSGLNALLTYKASLDHSNQVFYHTIEPNPLPGEILQKLNYQKLIEQEKNVMPFSKLHHAAWETDERLSDRFVIYKEQITLQKFRTYLSYHLIYFDAFAPKKQADMWKLSLFKKLYSYLEQNGYLVTYAAQGKFKRDLRDAGFDVESLPGPTGKREMVRAKKF